MKLTKLSPLVLEQTFNAILECDGNLIRAATVLGVSHAAIVYRISKMTTEHINSIPPISFKRKGAKKPVKSRLAELLKDCQLINDGQNVAISKALEDNIKIEVNISVKNQTV